MIGSIWNTLFTQPITISLAWLANYSGNVGVAIVLLTIVIQFVLLPLRLPSLRSAKKIRGLQPRLDELKKKHSDDKMALAQAQMDLYKEHNVSVFGGILPTLLSIPIIITLYRVLLVSIGEINGVSTSFLWLNITESDPFYILPLLVAGAQYMMTSQMAAKKPAKNDENKKTLADATASGSTEDMMQVMQGQMKYIFPVMSGFITATLPSGVGLYWLTSVVFAIIQHQMVERKG